MTDFNRPESAEGMPAIEDHPPGIDVETDQEGFMVPRDAPIAAGGDPAYPVTAAGQRNPESLRRWGSAVASRQTSKTGSSMRRTRLPTTAPTSSGRLHREQEPILTDWQPTTVKLRHQVTMAG